jgi:hypothetical protein
LQDDEQRRVPWRLIDATETPVIREYHAPTRAPAMETDSPDTRSDEPESDAQASDEQGSEAAARYLDEARYSRSILVLPDGRRHVRETDHRTGEVREYVKAPRRA